MFDLHSYLKSRRGWVEKALACMITDISDDLRIKAAMAYSLMTGGKRIRPILCTASCEAVGGDASRALSTACALEMIHTYSLIHDDLPAMDDDALRRGKPTCHVAFGEAAAILAGDGLLTLAFQVLSHMGSETVETAFDRLNVLNIIASAAGCCGMIEGQMRDIESEGAQLSLEDLKALHFRKTGALIEASVWTGAVLGGGSPLQVERLRSYARDIGLAFQVVDDILNVEGDPELMGKACGTDRARGKNTYPLLMGIENSRQFAAELIHDALKALENFDNKFEPLRAIAGYILKRRK